MELLWGTFLRAGLWTAIFSLVFVLVRAIAFIITAVGLYQIAFQRKLPSPWLAWIPIARLYLLGLLIGQTLPISARWHVPYIQIVLMVSTAFMILGSGSVLGGIFTVLTIVLVVLSFIALFRQYGERRAIFYGVLAGVPYLEIIGCFMVLRLKNLPIPAADKDTTVFP